MKKIRKLALGLLSTSVLAALPMGANAGTVQLGFILDRSGSIGATNWNIIVDGLSNAIGSLIPVGGSDTYQIAVVSFSNTASIDVAATTVNTSADRTNLATAIYNLGDGRSADVFSPGQTTNYTAAFTAMDNALRPTSGSADATYVNFATDGFPNPSSADGVAVRNSMISSATNGYVDNISIEAIGSSLSPSFLQNNICYPTPCDTSAPYNFAANGFYIGVADATAYAAAIANKIRIVTGQVPEPASLALVGLALAGMGVARRASKRASMA